MKKLFPGYYRPTKNEFSKLWKNCIFVFDANVLLNLYRYSSETREELLLILQDNSERLWLPHQAALEYHQNRLGRIEETANAYEDIQRMLRDSQNKIKNELHSLAGKGRHPFVNETHIIEEITNIFSKLQEELVILRKSHPDLIKDDPILKKVTDLFETKVGSPYSFEQLTSIYQDGKERYDKRIPPGYLDNNKDDSKKYGDLILWHQIIDKAKEQKRPIILVTDDRKDDWWKKIKGQIIGPRPDLIQEMVIETGILFYMYAADPFMEMAHRYLKRKVSQKAVDEVREYRKIEEKNMTITQDYLYPVALRATMAGSPYSEAVRTAFANTEAIRASLAGSEAIRAAMASTEAFRASLAGSEAVRAALASTEGLGAAFSGSEAVRAAMANTEGLRAVFAESEAIRAAMASTEAFRASLAGSEAARAALASTEGSGATFAESEAVRATRSRVIATGLRNTSEGLPPASEKILDSNEEEKECHSENMPNTEIASKKLTTKQESTKKHNDSDNL